MRKQTAPRTRKRRQAPPPQQSGLIARDKSVPQSATPGSTLANHSHRTGSTHVRPRVLPSASMAVVWLVAAAPLVAAQADAFEQRLMAIADTASARRLTYELTRAPHVAGTPAQAVTRDYVLERLRAWGLEAWSQEYTVYLPYPDSVAAWGVPGPGPPAEP